MNSCKTGQCYPGTYHNGSFHGLVFEEMDGSLAARPSAAEGFRDTVRVLTFGGGEEQGEDAHLFSPRASSGSQLVHRTN